MSEKLKTASITFHSAHNYGAMLQIFAFQQCLHSLGVENEIIDLRPPKSKEMYHYPSFDEYPSYKKVLHLKDVLERRGKYQKFESFLLNDLVLTDKEFSSVDEIKELDGQYDFFISAGDQIWNTKLKDWTPAFLLKNISSKRIAYAVSMGPSPEYLNDDKEMAIEVGEQLKHYDSISVREERSAVTLDNLYGITSSVNLDSAFLLTASEWEEQLKKSSATKMPNRYLLAYCPDYERLTNKVASELSHNLHLKTVTTTLCPLKERLEYGNLRVRQNAGPWEFLSIIKNAEFVLCRSYHAVVFSLIFHKPFFFFDTKNDSRIAHLLGTVGMRDRIVTSENLCSKIPLAYMIDFDYSDRVIRKERENSIAYLKHALGLIDENYL